MKKNLTFFALLILFGSLIIAQTTGKISGKVTDEETGEPLIGANVLIEGTYLGAATDIDGQFFILNIPPGTYSVKVTSMGYSSKLIEGISISVNRTFSLEVSLSSKILEIGEVVIKADKVSIKKDQTSSIRNISSKDMETLPIESAADVVSFQPGFVKGRFRGGRTGETNFLIDGISTTNGLGRGSMVNVDVDALQEVEVITGIFSAKYGNAQGGIVNYITKDGGNQFHGKVEGLVSNFFTGNTDKFIGLETSDVTRNQDYKFLLHGPIIKDYLTFFINGRVQSNANYLNGIRRFTVTDTPDYENYKTGDYNGNYSGNNEYVPMNWNESQQYTGKLTYKGNGIKLSAMYIYNNSKSQSYSSNGNILSQGYANKYKPDGRPIANSTDHMFTFKINHVLLNNLFYELKLSYFDSYYGNYVYEDPNDPRYINESYYIGINNDRTGFTTGGQSKDYYTSKTKKYLARLDVIWQINQNNSIETGFEGTLFDYNSQSLGIKNKYRNTPLETLLYEPEVMPDSSVYSDVFKKKPHQFSAWISDKMEYDDMVLNIGVRAEYFDPNTKYPTNYRNPANKINSNGNPEWESQYKDAETKLRFAPRLGFSYQLAETALLRFAYGHFYQYPSHYSLYTNNSHVISPKNFESTLGNPNLKPEKTVSYEVGLWQQISENLDFEVALFYKDMYDLSTVNIYTTYNNIQYGLHGNKDYANARGLELKLNANLDNIFAYLAYTLQYTRANADNPSSTFSRAGNNQDPIPVLIAMPWDQRHTLKLNFGYSEEKYSISASCSIGSGSAYSWSPMNQSINNRVNHLPNNSKKPATFNVDLKAYYDFLNWNDLKFRVTLNVYNLFDTLNENVVNSNTGRTNQYIIRDIDQIKFGSDFTTYLESITNPSFWSSPREVKLGFGIIF